MIRVRIVSTLGLAIVQDGGRPGRMHEGIPPGGPLAPELLAAANLAAGNPRGAPAIEHYGPLVVDATAPLQAASSEALLALAPGVATRLFPRRARVAYLAVAGGLDVPLMLGGRGALLVAGVGAPLRDGDTLPVGLAAGQPTPPRIPAAPGGPVEVILGPDPGDVTTLLQSTYLVSGIGDRAGVRLSGRAVRARTPSGRSMPMIRGAIQTTPSGELIVLGPDHPTTGGYPVVAVVVASDVGRVLSGRPGTTVTFTRRK